MFDTILLHLSEDAEPCAKLVRALLPHLSPQQKILLVLDASNPKSLQAARQFEAVGGIAASRTDLGCSLHLIELAKIEAPRNGAREDVPAVLNRGAAAWAFSEVLDLESNAQTQATESQVRSMLSRTSAGKDRSS